MLGVLKQSKREPTAPTLEQKENALRELLEQRALLESNHRRKQAEANHMRELAQGYQSNGDLLLTVSDTDIDSHPPLLREALRSAARAKSALDKFDSEHGGDEGHLRREIEKLHALAELEEQGKVLAADRADASEMLSLGSRMAELQASMDNRRWDASRRWPKDSTVGDVVIKASAGLRDACGWPEGAFALMVPTDICSCAWASVRLVIALQHPDLFTANDPILAKVEKARKEGFVSGTVSYPSR